MSTKQQAPKKSNGGRLTDNTECTDLVRAPMPSRVKLRDNGNYDIQVGRQAIWNITPEQALEVSRQIGELHDQA